MRVFLLCFLLFGLSFASSNSNEYFDVEDKSALKEVAPLKESSALEETAESEEYFDLEEPNSSKDFSFWDLLVQNPEKRIHFEPDYLFAGGLWKNIFGLTLPLTDKEKDNWYLQVKNYMTNDFAIIDPLLTASVKYFSNIKDHQIAVKRAAEAFKSKLPSSLGYSFETKQGAIELLQQNKFFAYYHAKSIAKAMQRAIFTYKRNLFLPTKTLRKFLTGTTYSFLQKMKHRVWQVQKLPFKFLRNSLTKSTKAFTMFEFISNTASIYYSEVVYEGLLSYLIETKGRSIDSIQEWIQLLKEMPNRFYRERYFFVVNFNKLKLAIKGPEKKENDLDYILQQILKEQEKKKLIKGE